MNEQLIGLVLEALGIVFLVQLVAVFAMLGFASARDSRERRQRAAFEAFMDGQTRRLHELRAERNELNGRPS